MAVIGVHLREISLKREDLEGELKIKNIKNNVDVLSVKERDFPAGESGKALIFGFLFSSDYELEEPKDKSFGSIRFVGDVAFTDKKKVIDSVMSSWNKNKKIEESVLMEVIQAAINEVNVEAIYLSRKVMLPSPIPLPQVSPPKKEDKK